MFKRGKHKFADENEDQLPSQTKNVEDRSEPGSIRLLSNKKVTETKKKNVFGVKRDSSRKSRASSNNQKDSEQISGRKPAVSVSKLLVSSNSKKIKDHTKGADESIISDDSTERPHNLQLDCKCKHSLIWNGIVVARDSLMYNDSI